MVFGFFDPRGSEACPPLCILKTAGLKRQVVDGIYVTPEVYRENIPQFGEKLTLPEAQGIMCPITGRIPVTLRGADVCADDE